MFDGWNHSSQLTYRSKGEVIRSIKDDGNVVKNVIESEDIYYSAKNKVRVLLESGYYVKQFQRWKVKKVGLCNITLLKC